MFHWQLPFFVAEELRWLATYVTLPRPLSFKQLISIGIPSFIRDIIEGGPPDGILSSFAVMFKDVEEDTHLRASELLTHLEWAEHSAWAHKSRVSAAEQDACSDELDPFVPGGCCRAPPHSRWNTPEF